MIGSQEKSIMDFHRLFHSSLVFSYWLWMEEILGELGGVVLVLSLSRWSLSAPGCTAALTVNMADWWGGEPDKAQVAVPSCCPSSVSIELGKTDAAADSANPIRTSLTNGIKTCVDSSSELDRPQIENGLVKLVRFLLVIILWLYKYGKFNLLWFPVCDHCLGDRDLDGASSAGQVPS